MMEFQYLRHTRHTSPLYRRTSCIRKLPGRRKEKRGTRLWKPYTWLCFRRLTSSVEKEEACLANADHVFKSVGNSNILIGVFRAIQTVRIQWRSLSAFSCYSTRRSCPQACPSRIRTIFDQRLLSSIYPMLVLCMDLADTLKQYYMGMLASAYILNAWH